jgi:hypothetical protein
MSVLIDLTGQRFGRLTVLRRSREDTCKKWSLWSCRCKCGNVCEVLGHNLRTGNTRSCGCLRHDGGAFRHGACTPRQTAEYVCWAKIKQMCTNPQHRHFKNYGGRGITMCKRWLSSYENFLVDVGHRPSPEHWLCRIDKDLGYSPANCRWTTTRRGRPPKLRL